VAAALLIDHVVPIRSNGRPRPAEDLPPQSGALRDAPSAELAAEEDGRGRDAAIPADIPVKGWKDILWRVYANVGDHRVLALAVGMTYYSILAIFPARAALVAIYGLFAGQHREAHGRHFGVRPRRRPRRRAGPARRVSSKGDRTRSNGPAYANRRRG
jgi:hypothetical protein